MLVPATVLFPSVWASHETLKRRPKWLLQGPSQFSRPEPDLKCWLVRTRGVLKLFDLDRKI